MERWPIIVLVAILASSTAATAQTSKSPTNQSAEEIVIKEKLDVAGVTKLRDLTRHRDGTWQARGIKDNSEVAVVVDTSGNIIFH